MQRFTYTILARGTGMALADALVTIYVKDTVDKAILYADNDTAGATLANPLTSDAYGNIEAFVPDGEYDLRVDHAAQPTRTIQDVQIYDLAELAAGAASNGPLAAVTGAANQITYWAGDGIIQNIDFYQVGRDLLAATTPQEQRDTLDIKECLVVACSDETTDLTVGTGKETFRMPYAFELTDVRASVGMAHTGAALQVDVNEGGVSIFTTPLTIDDGEKTSKTAAVPAVIGDAVIADDAEMTIDIDQVGSVYAGAGLKVALIGRRLA